MTVVLIGDSCPQAGMLLENTQKGSSLTAMLKIPPNPSLSIEITEKLAYLPDLKFITKHEI